MIIQLHWDLPVNLGHLLCQVDWRLDDLHHACSLPWGKHLEELAYSLAVVYLLLSLYFQYFINTVPLKPYVLLGGSPCYPPPCPVRSERRVCQQERRWRLKSQLWQKIILLGWLMYSWSLDLLVTILQLFKMGRIRIGIWSLFPPAAWSKGTHENKAGNQMTNQQYGIFWLAEFSQVQDLSVVLMSRPTLTIFGVFTV